MQPRLGITELADLLGLAKPTVHGLLRIFEAQELVEQDPETTKYRLGPTLLQLGNAFLDDHELRARSLGWAESLATRANEAVQVGMLYGSNVLGPPRVSAGQLGGRCSRSAPPSPGSRALRARPSWPISTPPGRWSDRGALGQADRAHAGLAQTTEQEVARIRRDGFAVEDQEAIVGEAAIAAPVFDLHGTAAGAIGVTGPTERLLPMGPDPSW